MNEDVRLKELATWRTLQEHHERIKDCTLRELFDREPDRGARMNAEGAGLYLDFSKHRVTATTIALLTEIARERRLSARIEAMFTGAVVNLTEGRPALHVALRAPATDRIFVDGEDVIPQVQRVLEQMERFAESVRSGAWRGYTGRPIRNIVNIGIGGSDLGPRMAYEALRPWSDRTRVFRFVSNLDPSAFAEATQDLDAAETLFIVASKSFTTLETMINAQAAREWLLATLHDDAAVAHHFVAVSTNLEAVSHFGIDPANMFEFWDWVGGRYSLASAIGLANMIAIGGEQFRALLAGMHAMDEHFRTAPFEQNLPVLMGLLGVWYGDCFGAQTTAVLPYSEQLARFPEYLQQLTMESNGKHASLSGGDVDYQTGSIYWGAAGTNGQHSFMQLLHQGTVLVPADLIGFCRPTEAETVATPSRRTARQKQHDLLIANMLAQAEALAFGTETCGDGNSRHPAHTATVGNQPTSVILADELTPATVGALIALYEHVVFTQATIWDIDPFDQWGVELGKRLTSGIADAMCANAPVQPVRDSSTSALIRRYRDRQSRD